MQVHILPGDEGGAQGQTWDAVPQALQQLQGVVLWRGGG
jgi:hypothetical protein